MSSLRNAVARRNHKERSQPQARSKWGLLEKHKDYSLRAADYNVKKKKLGILASKSRERHPDEFAFGMLSSGSGTQGKHGRDGDKNVLSHDTVRLLKTQDSGYLRTAAARGRREIERLKESVDMDVALKGGVKSGVTNSSSSRKVVFDENGEPPSKKRKMTIVNDVAMEDAEGGNIDPGETKNEGEPEVTHVQPQSAQAGMVIYDSDAEITHSNQISKKQLDRQLEASARLKAEKRRRKVLKERRAAKLLELTKRQKEILKAADQLELQRAKMARSIGGTNKDGVKFKIRERKR